jgi:hypothetical protein
MRKWHADETDSLSEKADLHGFFIIHVFKVDSNLLNINDHKSYLNFEQT